MNKIMNHEIETMENKVAFTIKEQNVKNYGSTSIACTAGERILNSTAQFREDGYLGWQIIFGENGEVSGVAFSSSDVRVTAEDYDWIFNGCIAIDSNARCIPEALFRENRKIGSRNLEGKN